jgi:hypothetical protein
VVKFLTIRLPGNAFSMFSATTIAFRQLTQAGLPL